jgi:hypothetical protein
MTTTKPTRSQCWVERIATAQDLRVRGGIRGLRHRFVVDTAYCTGLRRYGFRRGQIFDSFRRFKCDVMPPDDSLYTIQTVALSSRSFAVASFKVSYSNNA